jgi:hypothetical protein
MNVFEGSRGQGYQILTFLGGFRALASGSHQVHENIL